MFKSSTKRWVQRWHRRMGVASALVLLLLAVTGFVLNHSEAFGLVSNKLSRTTASWFYGDQTVQVLGQQVEKGWVYQLEERAIYFNNTALQGCNSPLLGAVEYEQFLFVACQQSLHVYNQKLQLQESLSAREGYPQQASAVGYCNNLCVKTPAGVQQYNFGLGLFVPFDKALQWQTLEPLPEHISAKIDSAFSWQRLLLDIHAGRFLGGLGVWVLDIFVLLFVVLSISGIYLWFKQGRSSAKKSPTAGK